MTTATEQATQFVSRQRAAELLDCSTQMVDKLLKSGRVPAHYLGVSVRIKVSDLQAALEVYDPKKPRGIRVAKNAKKRGR